MRYLRLSLQYLNLQSYLQHVASGTTTATCDIHVTYSEQVLELNSEKNPSNVRLH